MDHIIPHFSVMISGNTVMEEQLALLLKSLSSSGGLSDYYCTVFIPNSDVIKDRFIRLNAEIIEYIPDDRFIDPWSTVCRWNLKPKGNLVVGIDSDVVAWNDVNDLMKNCFKFHGMSARLAYGRVAEGHLKVSDWLALFKKCKIDYPKYEYIYYANNGVIALSSDLVESFKHEVNYCLNIANDYLRSSEFLPQIANTLAIYKCQMKKRVMHANFNFLPLVDGIPNDETLFYHYGCACGGGSLSWRTNKHLAVEYWSKPKNKFPISVI